MLVVAAALVAASCSDDDSPTATNADATGAELYEQSCASCHGTDLRGTDQGPSHLSEVYAPDHHPDESFRAAITQGSPAHHWDFGDMPAVERLGEDEIDTIIGYVRQQQETHGLEPYPPE
jgi:mono/diheme cytochrome c family protein